MINENPTELNTHVSYFGEWLISQGLLNESKLQEALREQRIHGARLGENLVKLNIFNEEELTRYLADYLCVDYLHIDSSFRIDLELARQVPEKLARHFNVVVLGEELDGHLILAMTDPLDIVATDTISRKMQRPISVAICSPKDIHRATVAIYEGSDIEEQRLRELVSIEVDTDDDEVVEEDELMSADISSEDAASRAPVIKFVDLMLSQAVKSKASDIHIEPQEKSMGIRMRVDGLLQEMIPPPRKMQRSVVTRIKILSSMDIAERRLPQDGRFKIKAPGRDIDVRVSTLPTIYGEKIELRILDKGAVTHDLDRLGFDAELLHTYKSILLRPHGIIIITGPTGSGKSTTLYASLNYLRDPRKNITTVEDPVEYRLAGINQVQVRPEINLDFATCLRSILRQDPDIVLLGEIRDKETAEIAIQTSLTGHLVLSTFHTNDAPSAITRLMYMGVENYLLASSLNLVVAQRLVRKICESCTEPTTWDEQYLRQLKFDMGAAAQHVFYHGRGCPDCSESGYLGRIPLFEFLVLNDTIRTAITDDASEAQIRTLSRQAGFKSLLDNGANKVWEGTTTPQEILKVTYIEDINL
ncbi:MAG: Flp pilus assembly complex ATPase component TadA [Sedimentisphaerales bacterium]|nr:Flp pilus assembly complex ATPase component TadA [Sedimentisphaerales bacterium]